MNYTHPYYGPIILHSVEGSYAHAHTQTLWVMKTTEDHLPTKPPVSQSHLSITEMGTIGVGGSWSLTSPTLATMKDLRCCCRRTVTQLQPPRSLRPLLCVPPHTRVSLLTVEIFNFSFLTVPSAFHLKRAVRTNQVLCETSAGKTVYLPSAGISARCRIFKEVASGPTLFMGDTRPQWRVVTTHR